MFVIKLLLVEADISKQIVFKNRGLLNKTSVKRSRYSKGQTRCVCVDKKKLLKYLSREKKRTEGINKRKNRSNFNFKCLKKKLKGAVLALFAIVKKKKCEINGNVFRTIRGVTAVFLKEAALVLKW